MASSRDVLTAWRIVKAAYSTSAFDGEGARATGGRWSSRGRRAVYTAQSTALAALELLVHLQSAAVLAEYVVIPCRFPRRFVTTIDPPSLPSNWRKSPAPRTVRRIGDDWLASLATAVLGVPSAIVDGESNYVLNPEHADFGSIVIEPPRLFTFDPRLLR